MLERKFKSLIKDFIWKLCVGMLKKLFEYKNNYKININIIIFNFKLNFSELAILE